MPSPRLSMLCLAVTLAASSARAQSGPRPEFAVASIKPARPDARGYSIRPLPGRFVAENVTLRQLIAEAFHVYDFQIAGGAKWLDADRFDVEGKPPDGSQPGRNELRAMLRSLLEARFGLRVRRDSKEAAVFLLVVGKSGSRLQPPKQPDAPPMFRVFQRRQITSQNTPLDHLTEALTWVMGKPVLDRTGLDGAFDYKLEWSPDEQQVRSAEAPPDTEGANPSLEAAIEQQLGLKLVGKKDRLEMVVVESAEKPAGN